MPTTSDPDLVELTIEGKPWAFFDDLEIHRGLDTHPSVGFAAPFDVERREVRDTFRQMQYQSLDVHVGGEQLFSGTLVEINPASTSEGWTVACAGYSLPAKLEKVNLPASMLPFEASGLGLQEIATRLAGAYGISVVMQGDPGAKFAKVKTRSKRIDTKFDHDQKIDDFLIELARQRGKVRTSDTQGRLVFWESVKPGNPRARFVEGQPGAVAIVPTFSPDEYYSEITGFTTAKRGSAGSKFTVRNERLAGRPLRALSFRLDDVEKADAPKAVRAKLGRMFGNAVSYVVNVPSWRDPRGVLWSPNSTITVLSPHAMIYRETELLIRDIYLRSSEKELTASLGCVLPGAFSGEVPDRMPWDE